jgi:hypothetical protein
MTDIPVGGFAVEESGWTRFKRQIGGGFRAIGRGIKTAAVAVWNATKTAATFVGRGAVKVLGLTGQSIGWLVGIVITAAILIAVTVMWLAITALVGLVWLLRWIYDGFDTYLVGIFRYLARKDRTQTFTEVNFNRQSAVTTGLGGWYLALLGLRARLENYQGPAIEGDIEKLVKEAEAAGHPLTDGDITVATSAEAEVLRKRAEAMVEEDYAVHINDNPVIAALNTFWGEDTEEGVKHTRVEFDFTPFINTNGKNFDMLQAFAWLRDRASDKAERSYWAGRWEALNYYERERNLEVFPREWALLYQKFGQRHSEYRQTEAKLGWDSMLEELKNRKLQPQTTRGQKR